MQSGLNYKAAKRSAMAAAIGGGIIGTSLAVGAGSLIGAGSYGLDTATSRGLNRLLPGGKLRNTEADNRAEARITKREKLKAAKNF